MQDQLTTPSQESSTSTAEIITTDINYMPIYETVQLLAKESIKKRYAPITRTLLNLIEGQKSYTIDCAS